VEPQDKDSKDSMKIRENVFTGYVDKLPFVGDYKVRGFVG
jgi:hypothetical protein